jgi:polyferredoxin
MTDIEEIKKELNEIKARNKRVEVDKAWETSWTRKLLILILTYIVIVIFFSVSKLGNPFVNAIVPTIGFFLSTLTIPFFKGWWIRKFRKKHLS